MAEIGDIIREFVGNNLGGYVDKAAIDMLFGEKRRRFMMEG